MDATVSFAKPPAMPRQRLQAAGSVTCITGVLEVFETDFVTDLAEREIEKAEALESYGAVTPFTIRCILLMMRTWIMTVARCLIFLHNFLTL